MIITKYQPAFTGRGKGQRLREDPYPLRLLKPSMKAGQRGKKKKILSYVVSKRKKTRSGITVSSGVTTSM